MANILAGPLVSLAPKLIALIKPGSPFALSGILDEQQGTVAEAYQSSARIAPARQRDEWILIEGVKNV